MHEPLNQWARTHDTEIDYRRGRADLVGTEKKTGPTANKGMTPRAYEEILREFAVQGSRKTWGRIRDRWRQALGDQLGQYSTDGRIINVGIDTADGAIQKLRAASFRRQRRASTANKTKLVSSKPIPFSTYAAWCSVAIARTLTS
jgi:hypothetical protein